MKIGVDKFCRSKINVWLKHEVIDNNLYECFNGYIIKLRLMQISDMVEEIRRALMKMMAEKGELVPKNYDILCRRVKKKMDKHKVTSGFYLPTHASNLIFEMTHFANTFVVDIIG